MLHNLIKLIQIISKRSAFGLLVISIIISLMEILSVFSIYPLFFYMENNSVIDNVYYRSLVLTLSEFFKIGLFECIVLTSVFVVIFTNTMVFFRYLSKSKIKERVVKENRQYVLNLVSNTTLHHFSKVNSNSIHSYLSIDSERVAQIVLSFTNMISSLIVILLITLYLIFIDLQLFIYLTFIVILLLTSLKKSFVESKKLGEELSKINEKYIKYIQKVLNDKVLFMLSDSSLIKKSFDVDIVRTLHQNRFDIQKYSSYIEFMIKTVTMISILLVMYFFYNNNTDIALILFSGVLFVRLIPFLSQFGNAMQNFKSNLPIVEKLVYLESKLLKADFIDLNEIDLKSVSLNLNNLQLKNIKVKKDIIELRAGNIYGLFGASGVGKTSLAQAILGLDKYGNFIVKLNDKLVISNSKKQSILRNSIYLSQHNIPSEFSIRELFINFDVNSLSSMLNRFGFLEENKEIFFHRKLSSFSGGEQQKLNFIYTILQAKKIIVFDEPTSSMDDSSLNLIMDILEEYVIDKNAIIILISHSQIIKDRVTKAIILQ
jgi:ABC-type multidrug transport system fused ATPase/permease subunit